MPQEHESEISQATQNSAELQVLDAFKLPVYNIAHVAISVNIHRSTPFIPH